MGMGDGDGDGEDEDEDGNWVGGRCTCRAGERFAAKFFILSTSGFAGSLLGIAFGGSPLGVRFWGGSSVVARVEEGFFGVVWDGLAGVGGDFLLGAGGRIAGGGTSRVKGGCSCVACGADVGVSVLDTPLGGNDGDPGGARAVWGLEVCDRDGIVCGGGGDGGADLLSPGLGAVVSAPAGRVDALGGRGVGDDVDCKRRSRALVVRRV